MNNQSNKLSVSNKDNFSIQSGTIPTGVTAGGSKYPVNSADVSISDPNDTPLYEPFIPILYLYRDFTIELTRNWTSRIKPGNPLQIIRGNIRSEYNVQYIRYNSLYDRSTIKLSHTRDLVDLLDPFISSAGYPNPAIDSYVTLDRRVENPNVLLNSVNSFSVRMIPDSISSHFNINVKWDVDPNISSLKLRWRSVPRNYSISELSFSLIYTAAYSQIPIATIISDTGRNANITLSGSIFDTEILSGGSGYTSAYATVKDYDLGATFSVGVSGGSVTNINIISGGLGYPVTPELEIHGNAGATGASVKVTSMLVNGIKTVQQGTNYLSIPTVVVDPTYRTTSSDTTVDVVLTLNNTGKIDYVRVLDEGTGYTGASVSIIGGSPDAIATPVITNGAITDINVIFPGSEYFSSVVVILPIGTGGTGAQAIANTDIYSQWVYEDVNIQDSMAVLTGFKYNIPYEIEILASEDLYFKGINKYTNNTHFQYYK
jgi:hypothetical protein